MDLFLIILEILCDKKNSIQTVGATQIMLLIKSQF